MKIEPVDSVGVSRSARSDRVDDGERAAMRRQTATSRASTASAHARRCRSARGRAQSRTWRSSGSTPKSRPRASARASGAFMPVFSTVARPIEQRHAAVELAAGRSRRGRQRLVLVDRRPAAHAVGRRHLERVVGHRADDDEQSDQQLRSEPAVGHSAGVLAAAAQGPQDRRGAAAVHHREAESGQLRAPLSAKRSSRRWRRSNRRTGR